jgi:hypothetical protein
VEVEVVLLPLCIVCMAAPAALIFGSKDFVDHRSVACFSLLANSSLSQQQYQQYQQYQRYRQDHQCSRIKFAQWPVDAV